MNKPIFIRGLSDESYEAEKYLKENNIDYLEIINENDIPSIITPTSIYAYDGLIEIKEFVQTRSQ